MHSSPPILSFPATPPLKYPSPSISHSSASSISVPPPVFLTSDPLSLMLCSSAQLRLRGEQDCSSVARQRVCVCVGLSERTDVGMKNTKIIAQLINVSHFTRMMNLQRVALNHACNILSFTSLIHLPLSVLFVSSSPGRLEITGVLLQATDRCCLLMHERNRALWHQSNALWETMFKCLESFA